jgi:predicted metalloprotease with PDZ domain
MESPRPGVLVAPTYDRLVDSPIEMGTFDLVSFEAAGASIEFAIWGDWDGDAERLEADTRAIVEAAAAVYGDMPTERYVFLTHSAPGLGGGTEYFNSTVVHTDPARWWDEKGYANFLSLLAHEFFHLWNVKRFRPAGIAATTTSRRTTRTCSGSPRASPATTTPCCSRAPASSTSRTSASASRRTSTRSSIAPATAATAWRGRASRPGPRATTRVRIALPDKANRTISFYSQGALLGLVLDLEIRAAQRRCTQPRRRHARPLRGLPARQRRLPLRGRARTAWNASGADRWRPPGRLGAGHGAATGAEALAKVGWKLGREGAEEDPEPTLGVRTRSADGGQYVRYVRIDGPAWEAGVNVDDVLLAIDGVRIGNDLDELLERHAPGDVVELALFRDGRLRMLSAQLGTALRDHEITPAEAEDPVAESLRSAWLGGHVEAAEGD